MPRANFSGFSEQQFSDEILDMMLQPLGIEDKRQVRFVNKRWKKVVDWRIKMCIALGKIGGSKEAQLFHPSKYQYVTCISVAGERNELQQDWMTALAGNPNSSSTSTPNSNYNPNSMVQPFKFPVKFPPTSMFSHNLLRRLVIGPGVSGLSPGFLSRILACSSHNLERLSWTVDILDKGERRENSNSKFALNSASNSKSCAQNLPSSSQRLFTGLVFRNLTELSVIRNTKRAKMMLLKVVDKPGRPENSQAFCALLQTHFPKLYSLSALLISEPVSKVAGESVYFEYSDAWPIYFETFRFISRHGRNLRVLALDYSNLRIESNHGDFEEGEKKVKEGDLKKVTTGFKVLELYNLNLYCAEMEGTFPWNLCSPLLQSQFHLTELLLKTRGSLEALHLNTVLCQNPGIQNLYVSNPGNFSTPFDLSCIAEYDDLQSLEINYCSGFLNPEEIPDSIRKLKLRTCFNPEDLAQMLPQCPYLRKLYLSHNGNFWEPVSLETVQTCLENSLSLRRIFMDNFDIDSISRFCNVNQNLKLSILKKNRGRLRITGKSIGKLGTRQTSICDREHHYGDCSNSNNSNSRSKSKSGK